MTTILVGLNNEIYSPIFLAVRSSKSRYRGPCLLWRLQGELGLCFFQLLVAVGKPWLTAPSLQSASLVTWSPLCSMSSLPIMSNLCIVRICGSSRWLSGREPTCKCRRHGFHPWVRKIPWRRSWQPTLVFLPGKSHKQRSLVGYSQWGLKELDTIQWLNSNRSHWI